MGVGAEDDAVEKTLNAQKREVNVGVEDAVEKTLNAQQKSEVNNVVGSEDAFASADVDVTLCAPFDATMVKYQEFVDNLNLYGATRKPPHQNCPNGPGCITRAVLKCTTVSTTCL